MVEPIEILLVEDNPGDYRLAMEVFKEAKVNNTMHIVTDGVEALKFLKKEGKYKESPVPTSYF